jgi:hypothetical protein
LLQAVGSGKGGGREREGGGDVEKLSDASFPISMQKGYATSPTEIIRQEPIWSAMCV